MPKVIIADTSSLIILTKIGELDLLYKAYKRVIITHDVFLEYGEKLPLWIDVRQVNDHYRQQLIEMQLAKGEASAIALALETDDALVILDDWKARKIAERLRVQFTGTIGVLIKAKHSGIITSIKPFLMKIRETNFRISDELEQIALKEANEK